MAAAMAASTSSSGPDGESSGDPEAYAKRRDGFLRDLQHFHEIRGTPFKRVPKLKGHEVDLHLLYNLVCSLGGWIKVNSRNSWPELFRDLGIPENCVNASVCLKYIYIRYLERWEKVHFHGEEADRASDDDEESRHKRFSAKVLHSVPLTYNYQQHKVAESSREYNHLSTELYKASDYDRLALSLLSPLPNEQDFAINVCTLLSNDGKHTLKLERHPRLLDYLLGHAGVFTDASLRRCMSECYNNTRKQDICAFWKETLESDTHLDLTCEGLFVMKKKHEVPIVDLTKVPLDGSVVEKDAVVEMSDEDSDVELFAGEECALSGVRKALKVKFKPDASDRDLFNLGRNVGTRDYMGQRVLQVATILRNLSFFDENVTLLVKNCTFVRFALLCACSRWNQLMNLGMEMLGNMASEFLVRESNDKISTKLLKIVTEGLKTEDRNWWITALEVLNKLSQNEANEDHLLRYLESDVYERVCSFLTIHDVMLLIYTLECLYSLSSLGERACNYIVNTYGVIDTLVSLVTVEGKSYGPKACIGMRLVETVTGGSVATQSVAPTSTTSVSTSVPPATSIAPTVASPSAPAATPVPTSSITTPVKAGSLSTPQRSVQIAPQRLISISPATSVTSSVTTTVVSSTQQALQQKHAHQQAIQENEQFALAWLRATYEPIVNGKVDHQELYKHYINACAKIGRRGVIAPLHFPRCVRSVFGGTVGPNPEKPTSPTEPQFYEGIKVRAVPLVISIQAGSIQPTSDNTPPKGVRRKSQTSQVTATALQNQADASAAVAVDTPPTSPASPILKAQLSAPPKQPQPTPKPDVLKSQVMAHPHLSQALLGSGCANSSSTAQQQSVIVGKEQQQGQSNTSLIKSLLATKVNECMSPVSMRTDCQTVAQVAARQQQQQQKLLAQQQQQFESKSTPSKAAETPKNSRLNGARQLFSESDVADPVVSSTTQSVNSTVKSRREPPQPPPPLAPLSNNNKATKVKIENEDSDSLGNNSMASSTGGTIVGVGGAVSSTEETENSFTSFEGLLNGVPCLENNDDSNSKDSIKNSLTVKKHLMLADLLEKKIDKDPPILNGVIGKERSMGATLGSLVENHIEKVLSKDDSPKINNMELDDKYSLKRSAPPNDDIVESEAKKPHLVNNVNGKADSPAPDSVSSSNGDEGTVTASTAAAKLFADLAADILEDEEEEMMQEQQVAAAQAVAETAAPVVQAPVQQVYVDNSNQQVLMAQPRQIIVSQNPNQVVVPAGAQLKTQTGQTVIVQNAAGQQRTQVLQQNMGQILLSQGLQGQMQLLPSGQPGQYVISTGGPQGYVVAQPQTAVVHGQPQTVLVAQTAQQQGTGTKTIIILQQNTNATQKVVMTPQGQQMVVTQVQRPMLQQSQATVIKAATTTSVATPVVTQVQVQASVPPPAAAVVASNGVVVAAEKKPVVVEEKVVIKPKAKVVRDLTTPFVCEWGDCLIDIKFKSANQVYMHVCATHIPDTNDELLCQWDRCDNMKRKRFSLMTHINDKHCNLEAMKTSLIKRKQFQQTGKSDPPAPAAPAQHPGYAPDAAFHAIKRHALEFVNPKELQRATVKQGTPVVPAPVPRTGPPPSDQDDNEGPVTKSIRLTASLILRNLVIYSSNCRRYLKHYEPHLANVALSNVESSRTIAQVLYDMNDCSNHR